MRKGTITRERIIIQAAELFNQQGYAGSSVSDIMRVTGLRKGGIYNHFGSKDELALEAFDYAINRMRRKYAEAIKGKTSSIDQLIAIVSIYRNIVEDPPLKGGCPLLNTAIESDDTHPALRDKAREAMEQFLKFIRIVINRGKRKGEILSSVDEASVSVYIVAAMEGGVMISQLYRDSGYMRHTLEHLTHYFESFRA
ncbi:MULTISPECIES: TetR/AcrR family transcriptional regulator [unclassified Paenibacillus]|uniref:TetR/AcrR family transcriptional regulator n=1 Tax=unclassified Paenibacillus TaxID=185978 RepID=UPI001C10612D|nr:MULTISPECIES: TetR/AcrR family transcriptional regulator [unclassified Paenibacillus]MBU5443087.1 TetR/AcrR family transcriptional regulator [Paenibacillus sp. MSJ-34]CAH0122260.1 putative HTH-type transcriptional regulator [Paenibacillus sp. CECT 9249]